jgi:hypothetical protein
MIANIARLQATKITAKNVVARTPTLLLEMQYCSYDDTPYNIQKKWYSTTRQCGFIGGGNSGFRMLSSPSASDSIDIGRWPIRRSNTILNIVPQGQMHVVERLGRLHSIEGSGYFFGIPFLDEIAYIIDVRERAIDIQPQVSSIIAS